MIRINNVFSCLKRILWKKLWKIIFLYWCSYQMLNFNKTFSDPSWHLQTFSNFHGPAIMLKMSRRKSTMLIDEKMHRYSIFSNQIDTVKTCAVIEKNHFKLKIRNNNWNDLNKMETMSGNRKLRRIIQREKCSTG